MKGITELSSLLLVMITARNIVRYCYTVNRVIDGDRIYSGNKWNFLYLTRIWRIIKYLPVHVAYLISFTICRLSYIALIRTVPNSQYKCLFFTIPFCQLVLRMFSHFSFIYSVTLIHFIHTLYDMMFDFGIDRKYFLMPVSNFILLIRNKWKGF